MDLSGVFIAGGIFAGALVSGFMGFAFSAAAGAVLLHALPAAQAVPLMMVCSLLVQCASLLSLRRRIAWRGSLPLIAGGLLGLPPALYVLLHADPAWIRVGFGFFLGIYACYMLFRPAARFFMRASGRRYEMAIGLLGGLIGGLTAMPGAIPTIWCDMRGVSKDSQRGLVQPYIAVMQVAALGFLASRHGLPESLGHDVAFSLAPLSCGVVVGLALFGKVSDVMFRRAVLYVLLVSGIGYVVV